MFQNIINDKALKKMFLNVQGWELLGTLKGVQGGLIDQATSQ